MDSLKYSSPISSLRDISLFYFANCPLPEYDAILNTTIALDYCRSLQLLFTSVINRKDISQAVSHIDTCLTLRIFHVRKSCKHEESNTGYTFGGDPFPIPEVVKVLNELSKLCEVRIHSTFLSVVVVLIFCIGKPRCRCARTGVCLWQPTCKGRTGLRSCKDTKEKIERLS